MKTDELVNLELSMGLEALKRQRPKTPTQYRKLVSELTATNIMLELLEQQNNEKRS